MGPIEVSGVREREIEERVHETALGSMAKVSATAAGRALSSLWRHYLRHALRLLWLCNLCCFNTRVVLHNLSSDPFVCWLEEYLDNIETDGLLQQIGPIKFKFGEAFGGTHQPTPRLCND
eukprot:4731581-Amphidinium_carterae.2